VTPFASFHTSMNAVAADTRSWDAIGQSEKIPIPALFRFNPSLCRPPKSTAVE
jgi:hypothetical protein